MKTNFLIACASLIAGAAAAPLERRDGGCSKYTIIDTRGTGELQGPSAGFITMNRNILSQVPGGVEYDTVYPADFSQISTQGTLDIVNKVQSTLESDPSHCFVLEGYSQGAAATVSALPKLTGASFDAVKAVFLIGDPMHKPGLACNVDTQGGKSTADASGLEAYLGGIPDEWVSKTMDVCNFGDGVCDTLTGAGITPQHLDYPYDSNVQKMGTDFVVKALTGSS
uniref:ARAD1B06842p n=1 Tax=Blastobotrys adeninivorans TaxID=409370 RepID=A0A060T5X1_BLAAD|nr:cutinase 1 [Blastobotrys adeninivorans]